MHGCKTMCPALLLRFLTSTAGKSRRSWKRCRPRAARRMESSVPSVPTMRGPRTGTAGGRSAPGRLVLGLRDSSAAKDPSHFIATGEHLLVDAFVAGHHGLGRKLLLD